MIIVSSLLSSPLSFFLYFKGFILVSSTAPGIGNTLTVTGFNLTDPDHNVDPIRMTVVASNNLLLSLNPNHLLPIVITCSYPSWDCTGSGVASQEFTGVGTLWCCPFILFFHLTEIKVFCTHLSKFSTADIDIAHDCIFLPYSVLGTPSELQEALNGLTLQSVSGIYVGTVTITLYDGVGGQCLTADALGPGSIRSECFERSAVFTVKVVEKSRGSTAAGNTTNSQSSPFSFKYYLIGGIGGGVVLIGVLRCCYLRRLHKQREK